MNKQWVQDSHYEANRCRKLSGYRVDDLDIYEYLDIIGLFETGWMITDHRLFRKGQYGYPR